MTIPVFSPIFTLLILSSFLTHHSYARLLEEDFEPILKTSAEILNLKPKNIKVEGEEFLSLERSIFTPQGTIVNKADLFRLLNEKNLTSEEFFSNFSLSPSTEDLYFPKEWLAVKEFPETTPQWVLRNTGQVAVNLALPWVGAAATRLAGNYVIAYYGDWLADIAARKGVIPLRKITTSFYSSSSHVSQQQEEGLFKRTYNSIAGGVKRTLGRSSDNFEYVNAKAEILRHMGVIADSLVKYSVYVGKGLVEGSKRAVSFVGRQFSSPSRTEDQLSLSPERKPVSKSSFFSRFWK